MRAFLLNLTTRPDRLKLATAELQKAGIPFRLAQKDPHHSSGRIGAKEHILELLETFGDDSIWIIEDDIVLHKDFSEIYHALPVPDDWELMYLGGALRVNGQGKPYGYMISPGLVRTFGTLHTHCVLIRQTIIQELLRYLPTTDEHWDVDLINHIQPRGRSYQCYPPLARQRPDYSNISQKEVAYKDLYMLQGDLSTPPTEPCPVNSRSSSSVPPATPLF